MGDDDDMKRRRRSPFLFNDEDTSEDHPWLEYRELVLREIERLSHSISILSEKIEKLHTDEIMEMRMKIAMLEVKSGVWGAIAGAITGVGGLAILFITKLIH